ITGSAGAVEQAVNCLRYLNYLVEADFLRVEIEHHEVRLLQTADPRQPRIQLDAAPIRQEKECRLVLAEEVINISTTRAGDNLDRLHPGLEFLTDILLEEIAARDAVGMPVQRLRAIAQMRQHEGRHAPVIVDEIALGVTFFGPVELVEVRE